MVSIIIPVYNAEPFIRECLLSVINQTYKHIEVVLIDDAGKDNSVEIAEKLLKDASVQYTVIKHSGNHGVSVARNEGAATAGGDYIYFLDADDYIAPHCIESMVSAAQKYNADMVYANHYDIFDSGAPVEQGGAVADVCYEAPLGAYVAGKLLSMVGNRLINKKFYAASGVTFREKIRVEDELWSFSLILRARRVCRITARTYYYRRWSGSFTGTCQYDSFFLECNWLHILNIDEESKRFNLWGDKGFRRWYARNLLTFFSRIFSSSLTKPERVSMLNRVYQTLTLPTDQLNRLTCWQYGLSKLFMLPKSAHIRWSLFGVRIKQFMKKCAAKLKR